MDKDIMLGPIPGTRRQGGQRRQWLDDNTDWAELELPRVVHLAGDRREKKKKKKKKKKNLFVKFYNNDNNNKKDTLTGCQGEYRAYTHQCWPPMTNHIYM